MQPHRIELLDSFRCLAVLSVLLYHFTDRWIPLFPYGHFFHHLFQFGYLGVQFFFMISGFVISYTLANTHRFQSFFVNRFSRLFPAMLLCSVLTLLIVRALDSGNLFPYAHLPANLVPGLTFTSPEIWGRIAGRHFFWINGSYWSLWVEVQFYVLAAVVYFSARRNFIRNLFIAGLVIGVLKDFPIAALHWHIAEARFPSSVFWLGAWKRYAEIFNLSFYIWWFLAGAFFFDLYSRRIGRNKALWGLTAAALFIFLTEMPLLYRYNFRAQVAGFLLMSMLFLLMIYRNQSLAFLKHRSIAYVGVISYSMYLIHEDIGVLLIHRYGALLGRASFLAPGLMIFLTIGFSSVSYRYYEKRAGQFIRQKK